MNKDKPKGPPALHELGVVVTEQSIAITKVLEKKQPAFFETVSRRLGVAIVIQELGDDLWDEPQPMQVAIVTKVIKLMDQMAAVDAVTPHEEPINFWKEFVKHRAKNK